MSMGSDTKRLAIMLLLLWLLAVTIFMTASRYYDLELFFALGFIGILVLVEMIDTVYAKPRSQRRLRYMVAAGVIVFGAIVARKVLEILGP
jgi:hypothetical protein